MRIIDDFKKYLEDELVDVIRDGEEYDISTLDDMNGYVRLVKGTPCQILSEWQSRVLLVEKRWLTSDNWNNQILDLVEYLVRQQLFREEL